MKHPISTCSESSDRGPALEWRDVYLGRSFQFGLLRWNLFTASVAALLIIAIPILAATLLLEAPFWNDVAEVISRRRSR